MNDQIIKKAKEINLKLKQDELILKYNNLAKEVANNSTIDNLEKNLNELKEKLCNELHQGLEENKKEIQDQINKLQEELNNIPLYNEYITYKQEVSELLNSIQSLLNNI